VGKRSEAYRNPDVDYVISYEELDALFKAADIDISKEEEMQLDSTIIGHGRGFAIIAGVTASVKAVAKDPEMVKDIIIDGLTKSTVKELKNIAKKGELPDGKNFIEVMACNGGCVNGCDTIALPKAAARQILTTNK
jgi:iron only hydrogenase large subunit-like protein